MDSIERKDLNTEGQNFNSKNIDELSVMEILEVINQEDKLIADKIDGLSTRETSPKNNIK